MATSLSVRPISTWKRLAIISFFSGLGAVLCLASLIALYSWYDSRPKPAKPWNTSALTAEGPPGFSLATGGKGLDLMYAIKNNTGSDYTIDDATAKEMKSMLMLRNGELGSLNNAAVQFTDMPIFMPAGKVSIVRLTIALEDLPVPKAGESDDVFHERLRAHLNTEYMNASGLVLYDDNDRYEINLPRWAENKPTKEN